LRKCRRRERVCGNGTTAQRRITRNPSHPIENAFARSLATGVPTSAQFARRLAENGCRVLVPLLINRDDAFSGNPEIKMTNQPHREWIYRMAFEMGRHIIGYEVQKVLAAIDWFASENDTQRVPA
jgi:hypothetical protein